MFALREIDWNNSKREVILGKVIMGKPCELETFDKISQIYGKLGGKNKIVRIK